MGKRGPNEREEPCSICSHWHDYLGGEPCAVCGHCLTATDAKSAMPSSLPNEILPGFLFLGSYDHASRAELLKALGIGHILNTVPTCQNLYKNSFEYYTVSATPPPLDECFQVLEKVRAAGEKVLVHCMSGVSRSPTVVIYYLMRHQGWRLEQAYAYVRDKRPSINITAGDAARLQEAEAQLFGASHFLVPHASKGQQQQQQHGGALGAGGTQQQQHAQQGVGGPFSWPGINMHATSTGQAAVMFNPQQPASLNFGGGVGAGAGAGMQAGFVFGAQQQQQQQHESMQD